MAMNGAEAKALIGQRPTNQQRETEGVVEAKAAIPPSDRPVRSVSPSLASAHLIHSFPQRGRTRAPSQVKTHASHPRIRTDSTK